jgi:DNA primase catalytic core
MANPGDFAYTVKQQADIVRIIGDYIKLKKAGAQNYSGLCPFHGEKTASFSVHATRQFYHCFGCGVSGDVFSFIQKIENITFPEAVRMVAQKLGIPLPKRATRLPAKPKKPACAANCSTSTSAPSRSFRNASAVPKALEPANISPAAA